MDAGLTQLHSDCLPTTNHPPTPKCFARLSLPQFGTRTMAPNRTLLRNVIFCDGNKPDDVLGGFRQNGAISKANFLDILEIVLDIQALISVQERTSRKFVWRRNVPLQSGVYDIFSKSIQNTLFLHHCKP